MKIVKYKDWTENEKKQPQNFERPSKKAEKERKKTTQGHFRILPESLPAWKKILKKLRGTQDF